MEQNDQEAIHDLRSTFGELLETSYGDGNQKFCALLEDLEYATNHINVARWKAEDAIPTDEQIKAAFASNDEKPEQQ